ncbi:MAG: hypothetical protein A3G76_16795 [Acidobacteria bacterium RIFCSPLOWO2_12_FULL_65_11]|nr:MAG: hypothetical protein A3H95_12085 [Acidobacteria bacterium RIFCSPLOWO2_02_FULL_64_15]OFW34476.1 MAG: hypothetical protein A3G76_16795 [Acidobacteria bacterium RIFCSPLOWO2_12_FULL_65_11]
MSIPAENDGARDGHVEDQTRAADQPNPRHSMQIARRHAWLGETASAAFGGNIGVQASAPVFGPDRRPRWDT